MFIVRGNVYSCLPEYDLVPLLAVAVQAFRLQSHIYIFMCVIVQKFSLQ